MISSQTSSKADSGRSKHATSAPAAASPRAMPRPIPLAAPVTSAVCWSRRKWHAHGCSFRLALNRRLRVMACTLASVRLRSFRNNDVWSTRMTSTPIAEPRRPGRGHDGSFDDRMARGLYLRRSRERWPTGASATRASPTPLLRDTGRCSWTCGCRLPPLLRHSWCGGGAWWRPPLPSGALNQLFEELINSGLAVATIDYRHALGAVPGPAARREGRGPLPSRVRGCAGRRHQPDRSLGESAGGHLAALIALTAQRPELEGTLGVLGESSAVDVVVDWYGVADLTCRRRKRRRPRRPATAAGVVRTWELLVGGQDDDAPPVRSATSRRRLRRSCSCTARPTRSWGTSTVRCLLEP